MAFESEFVPLALDQLHHEAAVLKTEGWRFIQTHAVNTDDGVDLYYSFMKDERVVNYRLEGVKPNQPVPSITDLFLAAFVFENEARELFGIDMRDIALDFAGAMYAPAEQAPMTFISPEQKAAREKAAKAAAAKAAKEAAAAPNPVGARSSAPADASTGGFVMTPERQARLDAKMATMSPEKKAKVEAALKARAAEAAAKAAQSAPAPASLDDDSVGAHSSAPATAGESENASKAQQSFQAPAAMFADEQLESLISLMDEAKAQAVRAALNMKGGE